ncbi:SO_0444 family Cu/Zn efflux transporter [bacterium]|nr:SO_0444 family Cu/Zn efflux transporter [bacterium]MBU1920245.1 SO_0444 family Cu/Zn efflux transporter [bacterium]
MTLLSSFLIEALKLFVEMAPYLTLGFILAGLMHAFVPRKTVARHLGDESVASAVKGAVVGVPLPLCSCGVIPTGIGMRKRGASRAATVSFLISTPQTGVDSIIVTYGFFGWIFAIFRPIAAFISGIAGGIAVLLFGKNSAVDEHWMKYHQPAEDALQDQREKLSLGRKLIEGGRFAFIDLFGDIALWLVIGILIAAAISLAVPQDFFSETVGQGLPAMLLMMLFGLPLYVCSTASVPIAAVLMTKGISAGAAFVFLMTGPATNAATMVIILRAMGSRVLALYLGSIAVLALLFGLGLDYLTAAMGWTIHPLMHHEHAISLWTGYGSALLLTVFMLRHFGRKLMKKFSPAVSGSSRTAIELTVEGMHCSHCVKAVGDSLKSVAGVSNVDISLETGKVIVNGEGVDKQALAEAVASAGYKVTKLS